MRWVGDGVCEDEGEGGDQGAGGQGCVRVGEGAWYLTTHRHTLFFRPGS